METKNAFIIGFEKRAGIWGSIVGAAAKPQNRIRTAVGMGIVGAAVPAAAAWRATDRLVDPQQQGDVKNEW